MKKLMISVALSSALTAGSAFAGPASQNDMDLIFNQPAQAVQNHQVQYLSDKEMKETEGEWLWVGPAIGATYGAWGYGGYLAGGGNFSWSGLGGALGGGALTGWRATTPAGWSYWGISRGMGALGFGTGVGSNNGW